MRSGRGIALVTAGAERVGAAIVDRLLSDGWSVAAHSRSRTRHHDSRAAVVGGDLSDEAGCLEAMDGARDAFGGHVALVVHNASLFEDDGPQNVTHERWSRHQAVNAAAPAFLIRTMSERLPEGRTGSAVIVLDQRVGRPIADQLSYTMSKVAAAALVPALARALAPRLRINGVSPGLVMPTPSYEEGRMERIGAMMPLGRNAAVEDVADAVAWLAAARSTTGQILNVDGGAHLVGFDRDFDRI